MYLLYDFFKNDFLPVLFEITLAMLNFTYLRGLKIFGEERYLLDDFLKLFFVGFIRSYVRAVRHACRSPYHVTVFIFVQFKTL
jgi:hypothetical protein